MRQLQLAAIAACLLAIVVGAVLLARDWSEGGGTVVRMSAEAFRPPLVTIERGESVTFRNESGGDKWPASDVHPTHELYRGFDAQRAVLAGESWSFTFERSGRWTYHDHLSPNVKGTIVVR
jgi:plastocyanin